MSSPPFIDSIYRIHCPLGAQIVIFLFKVQIVNGGYISASTFSSSKAGTIKVSAGSITIDRQGGEFTGILSNAIGDADNASKTGDAGNLDITASGVLSIVNGGGITSDTDSSGKAGTIKVSAGSITIDGQGKATGIASEAWSNADNAGKTGDAGSLDITVSGVLSIVNGGGISSNTDSSGKAGTVKVNADSIVIR